MAEREPTISLGTVFSILEKLRERDEEMEGARSGARSAGAGRGDQLDEAGGGPASEKLVAAVEALSEDEQADLVALLWLGSGDFAVDEWDDARRLARARWSTPAAQSIADAPLAGGCLAEGLALLGHTIGSASGRPRPALGRSNDDAEPDQDDHRSAHARSRGSDPLLGGADRARLRGHGGRRSSASG